MISTQQNVCETELSLRDCPISKTASFPSCARWSSTGTDGAKKFRFDSGGSTRNADYKADFGENHEISKKRASSTTRVQIESSPRMALLLFTAHGHQMSHVETWRSIITKRTVPREPFDMHSFKLGCISFKAAYSVVLNLLMQLKALCSSPTLGYYCFIPL